MTNAFDRAQAYVEENFDSYITDLGQCVAIPSVTTDKPACEKAAEWFATKLDQIGLANIAVHETIGNPVVYADISCGNEDAPTVLVYGHYDVQRPDPLESWESQPFSLERRGDCLYGRGTSDMKGQILAVLLAIDALLHEDMLTVNLKVLIEGNEEWPPPVLKTFIPANLPLLKADISLNCDAGMLGPELPTISYGLRGGSVNIIRVFGPEHDLHDGGYGGVVENPIHVLSTLIGGLHDKDGRITLPGFYESVRSLSASERSLLAALPWDEQSFIEEVGVPQLWGDPRYTPIERMGARPSLNVRRFTAGEYKGAIPHSAEAYLAIRLIPDQDPLKSHEQLKEYVKVNTPPSVNTEVEYVDGYAPYLVDRNLPAMRSLSAALKETWGIEPRFRLVGGGIPVVGFLKSELGIESLLTGFSLPGDGLHGPNERIHLPTVRRGIPALMLFLHRYGHEPS